MSFSEDPKYLVRHFVIKADEQNVDIYNTLFVSRLKMRKFITDLSKKYKGKLRYKVLTMFDCHGSENSETWTRNEIIISE